MSSSLEYKLREIIVSFLTCYISSICFIASFLLIVFLTAVLKYAYAQIDQMVYIKYVQFL